MATSLFQDDEHSDLIIDLGDLASSLLAPVVATDEPTPKAAINPAENDSCSDGDTHDTRPVTPQHNEEGGNTQGLEATPLDTAATMSFDELCCVAEGPGPEEDSGKPCWGGVLKDDGAKGCHAGFVSGKAHFKNKFCAACRQGITIAANRVRALTPELRAQYNNSLRAGFWNEAPAALGGGEIRIINNTITCDGPQLIVYRKAAPDLDWGAMPPQWTWDDGLFHLAVAKGTLAPATDGRRKSVGPGSAPKRQRPPMAPPSFPAIKRAASAPLSSGAAAPPPGVKPPPSPAAPPPKASPGSRRSSPLSRASLASSSLACSPATSTADSSCSPAPRFVDHHRFLEPSSIPAPLLVSSPTLSSHLDHLQQQGSMQQQQQRRAQSEEEEDTPTSPPTNKGQLAARLSAAYETVASLLEEAVTPLSPLRRDLSTEAVTKLLAHLNSTRAALETCAQLGREAHLSRCAADGGVIGCDEDER